jgi:hypothetical protein
MESDQKQARTDPRLHSFGLRLVEEWNALPDHIKSLESPCIPNPTKARTRGAENETGGRQGLEELPVLMRASRPPDETEVHPFAQLWTIVKV